MAIAYTDTAWNAAGTASVPNGSYKDVTDASAANGDLLVCVAIGEGYTYSGGTRSIATQVGSTGAWTTYYPTPTFNNDTEVVAGWAVASATASVTCRPTVRTTAGSFGWTGSAIVRIPAAEWTGTVAGVAAFQADADGAASVTLAGGSTYTVIWVGADYSAGALAGTYTPDSSTSRASFVDGGHYSLAIRTWTGQTAGTRSYGPSGLSGRDYTGVVIAIPEASGGGAITGAAAQTLPALTQAGAGTTAVPAFTASAAQSLPAITQAATAATVPPTFTATGAQALPALTQAVAASSTPPAFTATVASALPPMSQAATAATTPPVFTASAASSLGAITQTAAATSTPPGVAGDLESTLPAITQAGAGDAVPPTGTATIDNVLPSLAQSAAATTTPPAFAAAAAQTLPALTQTAQGAVGEPGSATIAQVLPALTTSASATFTPSYVATVASMLAAITTSLIAIGPDEPPDQGTIRLMIPVPRRITMTPQKHPSTMTRVEE